MSKAIDIPSGLRSLELSEVEITPEGTIASRQKRGMVKAIFQAYAGRTLAIEIKPPKRTAQQNKYYWLVLETIRRALVDAGYAQFSDQEAGKRTLHAHFASSKLGTIDYELPGGFIQTRPVSTRKLSKAEFYDYVEDIRLDEMVLMLGVELPDPDEYQEETGTRFRSYGLQEP